MQTAKTIISSLFKGGKGYYIWMGTLSVFVLAALGAYVVQAQEGLIITGMRDQVSWGLYIGNFTFLVGVAAAAVLLVIPAYVYHFKPIKEIALFGELMAISALVLCILFIMVDVGKPAVFWHLMPGIGRMNWPSSILTWDVIVLNGYLILNASAAGYVIYSKFHKRDYKMSIMLPIVFISIPWAFSIHTVTAFLFNGLNARPFWNTAVLAPRFIASALCAGPALMILVFQIIRKHYKIEITNEALGRIAEWIAYAIGLHLYLFGAEVFKEFYSDTYHVASIEYLYFGLHHHHKYVFWMWLAMFCNFAAFTIFLVPKLRRNYKVLNVGCVLIFLGVYLEKGVGLVIPGFIPGTQGEIYEYNATFLEYTIILGIWAFGALLYTALIHTVMPIYKGEIVSKKLRS
ncbi:MAG: polysulfide reductase NrfD [Spirochaetia bacterium]|nr:polysulfide reductase NrfD [Spirochaetia bacterium]